MPKKIRRYFNLVETKVKAFNMHNAHAFLPSSNLMSMFVFGPSATHISMKLQIWKHSQPPEISIPRQPKWLRLASIGNHIFGVNLSSIIKRNGFLSFQSPIVMIDTELEENWRTVGVANWISDQLAFWGPILTALCAAELSQMRSTRTYGHKNL